ncbi:related to cytochrome P450 CYP3/CYP5/CYP6/CYP9 subfamilies [Cephalotrichum gorgonifer]|uniref:Related to cytochrome P450 CYP3/CYP5/CYP6/CYP9 subfamilies n=1 Tax=Cephalotrichum gorgonifer TaxID=2041049 RepID=A0AAE8N147_9PEZI|nr:related to cytochrome P450 CYP3/CYP5/CYP6/CYP9 subfamilies [Cephalotrichum gorgonifer]
MLQIAGIQSVSAAGIATATAAAGVVYIASLWIYRLTLHPYAKYPGPFLGKVTSLYGAYHAFFGNIHLDVERCHQQYGKFVRYSPNGLLVNSARGYQDIYGPMNKVTKANSYIVHGEGNIIGMQDKKAHAKKKKIFQQGFSDVALRKHEGKVLGEIDAFCKKMLENEATGEQPEGWTEPRNMSLWCTYLTTDVICKVVFTTSWDLLNSAANRAVTKTLATVTHLIGIMHQTPLLQRHTRAAIFLPHLAWAATSLQKYSKDIMRSSSKIRKEDPSTDDVFRLYVEAKDADTGKPALGRFDVMINSANLLIAGSDTTASSMAATLFYLSRNADAYAKVIDEIRTTFSSPDEIRMGPTLNGCVYLRAAVNEAMRMCPVAPQPLWRRTEAGGCLVDGEYIPGGLNVGATIFSLHHDPAVFEEPYTYDMDRWINRGVEDADVAAEKERIKVLTANFVPFSAGPRQCLAKNFAMMELLLTLARLFWRMDFRKSSGALGKVGEGGKGLGWGREREGELQLKGYFTSHLSGPFIDFKARETVSTAAQ